ncbi:MAG: CapA family protein [Lachnospiraceae bacterium]|nr:CapA family protein [Lachnospiraceae bacterium]
MKNKIFIFLLLLLLLLGGCSRAKETEYKRESLNKVKMESSSEKDKPKEEKEAGSFKEEEDKKWDASLEGEKREEALDGKAAAEEEISLVMVGDILLHVPVLTASRRPDGSYDFNAIFSKTRDEIEEADLALVNEEVIIGGEELGISGYPTFNAPYEIADALVKNGFDLILHATNHALDKGKKGIINCIENWEKKYPDISYLGIHASREDSENIYIYEKNNIRLAILNYTYGTNGIPLPKDMPFGVDLLEEDKVLEDIKRAEEEADLTIVCPHWGREYSLKKSEEQEKWTKLFLDSGVDLVLGTHPHVIEPIEVLERENGEKMVVYYSLGNYVNWTSATGEKVTPRMLGAMAKVTIARDEKGRVIVKEYGAEALVCDIHRGEDGVIVYPLRDYSEEMAKDNYIRRQDDTFSYERLMELWDQIIEKSPE